MTPLIDRYAWLFFILVTCINGASWWNRGRREIATDPTLAAGYRRLVRGLVIWGNVPWVVMGAGILSGSVPGVFSYFNPRNSPFVVGWLAVILLVMLMLTYWVCFRGGAEDLARHPGIVNSDRPAMIRFTVVVALIGQIIAIVMMFVMDLQPIDRL